jgi:hypothetical protein
MDAAPNDPVQNLQENTVTIRNPSKTITAISARGWHKSLRFIWPSAKAVTDAVAGGRVDIYIYNMIQLIDITSGQTKSAIYR